MISTEIIIIITIFAATTTPINMGRYSTDCIVPLCFYRAEINNIKGPQTLTDLFCSLLGHQSSLCLSFNKQVLVGISISLVVLYGKGVSG